MKTTLPKKQFETDFLNQLWHLESYKKEFDYNVVVFVQHGKENAIYATIHTNETYNGKKLLYCTSEIVVLAKQKVEIELKYY